MLLSSKAHLFSYILRYAIFMGKGVQHKYKRGP